MAAIIVSKQKRHHHVFISMGDIYLPVWKFGRNKLCHCFTFFFQKISCRNCMDLEIEVGKKSAEENAEQQPGIQFDESLFLLSASRFQLRIL